jgi:hypothetical protein
MGMSRLRENSQEEMSLRAGLGKAFETYHFRPTYANVGHPSYSHWVLPGHRPRQDAISNWLFTQTLKPVPFKDQSVSRSLLEEETSLHHKYTPRDRRLLT